MKKVIVGIAALALAAAAYVGWNWLRDNRLPGFTSGCELYVYPGTPLSEVIDTLTVRAGAKWPGRLQTVFDKHETGTYMQPGHYAVYPDSPVVFVARALNNGWQTPVNMTLSGTLRLKGEIARKIAAQMMVDSAEVHAALNDPELLGEFGFEPSNVFAMLIPDTYQMYWTDDVKTILERQKKAYDAFWTKENDARAQALRLTRMEVSILASIVSGESNYVPEFPRIAGVYLNRLYKGMRLQADPTIAFCYDYKVNRILRNMLDVDSRYNTYRYAGLPPGPIYVPSRNTLNAVLNPDFGDGNLYFCADPSFDGSHRFARTYSQHRSNAKAFQNALNERIAAKKN